MTKKKKRKQTESNVSPEEKSIKLREVFQKGNTVTKLTFFVMGLNQIKNKQWVKGFTFLILEIAFIGWLLFSGLSAFSLLSSLGPNKTLKETTDANGFPVIIQPDHSVLILLWGLIACLVVVLFILLYWFNYRSNKHLYYLEREGKHIPTNREELASLLDEKLYATLMAVPLIGVLAFTVLPTVYMISMAFTNYDRLHATAFSWTGFQAFGNVLTGDLAGTFFPVLGWTLVWAIIVQNINQRHDNVILGKENKILWGQGYIEDQLLGNTYRISTQSFYQINPKQVEYLYQKAIEYAQLKATDEVIDAYCGIGTISLSMAQYVDKVYGVEIVEQAIIDAKENAKRNHIHNVEFTCQDAGEFMVNFSNENKHIDVVMVDPPRKGCSEVFLNQLITLSPDRIVYISCDVATQARDIAYLQEHGYQADICQPVDMFPQSYHIENIVRLSLKK